MNYNSVIQNTTNMESFAYTPYMIKPSNSNSSGYVSYIDLLKFGDITNFGYLENYSSFSDWQGFIVSVHEHLQNLNARLGGVNPDPNIISVTGVSISLIDNTTSINEDETKQVVVTISPSNATNKNYTLTSSNTSIARISSDNKYVIGVTGTATGSNVTIYVTTADGAFSNSITLKVYKTSETISVTGVTLLPTSVNINVGGTQTLTATVLPSNATNKNVTWSSSNNSIATINNGTVTGVAAGQATITVTTADGNKTATSAITVNNPVSSTYYWYIGVDNPASIPTSDIQTDNTKPGWHEIGSSLTGFILRTSDNPVVLYTTNTRTSYYIVIPNELNIYDEDDASALYSFTSVVCNITGYKAYQYNNQTRIVRGIIIK